MFLKRQAAWLGVAVSISVSSWPVFAWAQTDWYLLKSAGETIGGIQINRYQEQRDGLAAYITEVSHINRLQRQGTPFEITMLSRFEEDLEKGTPLKFSYQYQLNHEPWVDASGKLDKSDIKLTLSRYGQPQPKAGAASLPVAEQEEPFLFPDGPAIQNIYKRHSQDPPGSRFHFQTMHLGLSPQVVNAQVTLLSLDELTLADGSSRQVHKFEVKNSQAPENIVYEWRDASGKLYKAQTPDRSMEMVYASRQEVQTGKAPFADVMARGIPATSFAVSPKELHQAVYDIRPKKGQAPTSLPDIPQDARQQVTKLPDGSFRVTVSRKEAPKSTLLLPLQVGSNLQPYLQASPYIQANDAEIRRTTESITAGELRVDAAVRRLHQWVYQNIHNKDYDTAFAGVRETLASRSGDCTEHAVLLSALARALGIPSRVATGLLYLPDNDSGGRFVFHMWSEVWLGKGNQGEWFPLDATLPDFHVDVGRIKLADSSLNTEAELLALTQPVAQWMNQIRVDARQSFISGQTALKLGGDASAPVLKLDIKLQAKQPLEPVDLRLSKRTQFLRVGPVASTLLSDAPEALFTKGLSELAKGNLAEARRAFEQSIQKTANPLALYRLGERLLATEMEDLAFLAFERAASREPRLAALAAEWRDEVRKGERSVNALEAIGDSFIEQGAYLKAKEAYMQAERAMGGHSRAWLGYRKKRVLGKQKLATGSAMLQGNRRNAAAWMMVGQGLQACGETEEAKKAFQNVLKLQPDSAEAWLALSAMAISTGELALLSQAEPVLAQLQASHAEAVRLLGLIRQKRRQYQEAQRLLEAARNRQSGHTETILDLVGLYQRMPLYEENIGKTPRTSYWTQRAINALQSNVRAGDETGRLRLRLGHLLLEQGKPSEAVVLAEQLLAEDPLNARAYWLAGTARLHQSDFSGAKTLLDNAFALDPFEAGTLVSLGQLAEENGDKAKAVQWYRQALQLNPNHPDAVAALQRSRVPGIASLLEEPTDADEQDYLAEVLWMYRQWLLQSRDTLKATGDLLSKYGTLDFSIASISLLKELSPLLEQASVRQSELYQTLYRMEPPLRFAPFHHSLLAWVYADWQYKNNNTPGFYSKQEIEEILKSKQAKEAALTQAASSLVEAQDSLKAQLPKTAWDMAMQESGCETLGDLLEEIEQLKKDNQAKQQ